MLDSKAKLIGDKRRVSLKSPGTVTLLANEQTNTCEGYKEYGKGMNSTKTTGRKMYPNECHGTENLGVIVISRIYSTPIVCKV